MSNCLCLACDRANPITTKFCTQCGARLQIQDRYRALRVIGQGGFGKTFLAQDESKPSHPRCVIKQFLYNDPATLREAQRLFEHEALRLDDLGKHPQIPELLAHCEQEGRQYLVQEFVDGENLLQELKRRGALSEAEVRDVLGQVLRVLDYIHRRQVIHRDIKPENIMRRRRDQQLVLVDFGAAKYASTTALAKTGTSIGSAGYSAPEQARGKAVFASDLYGLGVTCLHLLTGVDPFTLFDDSNLSFPWRGSLNGKQVSGEFGKVLDKLTQYRPVDRYDSVDEVLTALVKSSSKSSNPASAKSQLNPPVAVPKTYTPVSIQSAKGIDYRELELLLETKQWRKSDELTAQLMLKVANREKEGWLDEDSIKTFPREDLRTIDQLWVHYSGGKFGFSVQKKLWLKCGGKIGQYDYEIFKKLGAKLDWYCPQDSYWRRYDQFIDHTQNAQSALLASFPSLAGLSYVSFLEFPEMYDGTSAKVILGFMFFRKLSGSWVKRVEGIGKVWWDLLSRRDL
jgi:serine/threonine protein kinase